MKANYRILLLASLVTLVLLRGQPVQVFASAVYRPPADGIEDTLRAIAEASVAAQNQVLVSGDVEETLENDPLAPFYKDAIWDRLVYAQDQRVALAADQLGYMSFNTQWTVNSVEIAGATGTIKATEYTVLKFDVASVNNGSPPATEYVHEHIFTFTSQGGQWTLVSDQLLNIPGPVAPTVEERAVGPAPTEGEVGGDIMIQLIQVGHGPRTGRTMPTGSGGHFSVFVPECSNPPYDRANAIFDTGVGNFTVQFHGNRLWRSYGYCDYQWCSWFAWAGLYPGDSIWAYSVTAGWSQDFWHYCSAPTSPSP